MAKDYLGFFILGVEMIKKNSFKWSLIVICLILVLPVIGCSAKLVDQEYTDFSEQAAENYLIAVNNRDFNSFSKDLSKEMKEALPEEAFYEFSDQMKDLIGTYESGSKKLIQTAKKSGYIIAVYNAKYTGESSDVEVRITLQKVDDKIVIAGSWFNSPILRGE